MKMTSQHDSRAVANKILDIADFEKNDLTIMKLVKLIFLSNGWNHAKNGTALVKDKAQAWQYGPVYPLVYKALKDTEGSVIKRRISDKAGTVFEEPFSVDEEGILTAVVKNYAPIHAFNLSRLTHKVGSPWYRTFHEIGAYKDIPERWISDYYCNLSKTEPAKYASV